jgi:hypothetical protein
MVDLETLGTTADAGILSIGAVSFNLETGEIDDEAYYASISIESNMDQGRRVSEDTLLWWLKQSSAAQQVFHEPKVILPEALEEFVEWLPKKPFMWSNGADFDLPMLAHAMTQLNIKIPWDFWNNRCVRTYKGLPGAKAVTVLREGVHHNALADAIHQAKLVAAIHDKLFSKATA